MTDTPGGNARLEGALKLLAEAVADIPSAAHADIRREISDIIIDVGSLLTEGFRSKAIVLFQARQAKVCSSLLAASRKNEAQVIAARNQMVERLSVFQAAMRQSVKDAGIDPDEAPLPQSPEELKKTMDEALDPIIERLETMRASAEDETERSSVHALHEDARLGKQCGHDVADAAQEGQEILAAMKKVALAFSAYRFV